MSHHATSWAFRQDGITPTQKLVLLCLADRHNPDFGCFPSQERLAKDCNIHRATLNRALDDLEAAGLIRRERRHDAETRRQLATRYLFAFEDGADAAPDGGAGAGGDAGEAAAGGEPMGEPCRNLRHGVRVASARGAVSHSCDTVIEPVREPVSSPPLPPSGGRESAGEETEKDDDAARRSAAEAKAAEERAEADRAAKELAEADAAFAAFVRGWRPDFQGEHVGRVRKAWDRLSAEERRAAVEGIEPFYQVQRRKKRTIDYSPVTYLRGKLWTTLRPFERAADGPAPMTGIRLYSADFWFVWVNRVARGEARRAAAMTDPTMCSMGVYHVPAGEAPTVAQVAGMAEVMVGSAAFRAWDAHFKARGVRMPRPDRADRIFMPAAWPGGLAGDTGDGDGRDGGLDGFL